MKKANLPLSGIFTAAMLFLLVILPFTKNGFSQTEKPALKTEIYKLDNGLTIYLNEDPSLPNIFGAVVVKGGSKRDPSEATGIAHYFEHIMFKGTDQIGTLDFATEKVYLDSIAALYDELADASEEADKLNMQREINRLSIKAAEYAIPNEIEKILGEMGCAYLNAGTGNDGIAYFNVLPANQVEKWLEIYSHRFINPVYRLFQSELETVYEEYNMYSDNRFATAFEEFTAAFYPDHPYGVPILGYPNHLKYPSMKKMHEYFETYYVANNMALVLSGNFDTDAIKPLISNYFGRWKSGKIPEKPSAWKIEPFEGRQFVEQKLTPVKFGIRAYRSVPQNSKESVVLNIVNALMSNESQTGLLDELVMNNKLMMAQMISDRRTDAGGEYILFVPKVVGQSLKKAEDLIGNKLNDLKAGNFDESLLEAIKTEIIVNYQRNFEDQFNRGYMMITTFMTESEWEDMIDYPNKVKQITKADVLAAANNWFGENYLAFHSKTGLPKKPQQLKPPFENIPAKNTGEKSAYAKMIEEMEVPLSVPQFIEFGSPQQKTKDVTVTDITSLTHLFHVENKVNDLFDISIDYGIGTYEMPILNQVAEYMYLVGPEGLSFGEFKKELQSLGGSLSFYASKNDFTVEISGPKENTKQILDLAAKLLDKPDIDQEKIKNLYESAKTSDKINKKDPETLGYALYSFAVFGDNSQFLKDLTAKEIKSLQASQLTDALKTAMTFETAIHYSGTHAAEDVASILADHLNFKQIKQKSKSPVRNVYRDFSEPMVFFLDDKNAIQSKDYFFIKGDKVTESDKPLLNAYYEYLDGGMSSVMFQEIREFRSLAYATGASVYEPFYPDEETTLTSFVGTQADKTQEAIQVMHQIITNPPDQSDRIDMLRRALVQSINSKKPPFRQISYPVAQWTKQGYNSDPRKEWVKKYDSMSFEDIVNFHKNQFYQQPVITTIIGNKKRIGIEWMNDFGKVTEVRMQDIFR
ncbi:MAG: insulinase family protein [Bacteroidales bacterium]|nr:insulinase family protein [Bacteroidales bacterium]